jgi:hypothetical protein
VAARPAPRDANVDQAALLARVDAVAHRVLDQREQRHRRAVECARLVLDLEGVTQAVGHAHVHQLE